ncbi:PAS domain-containing protein [Ideonella sp. DXS29W]|uniref:PAS domain-containing protein n=1 Tax=Ideonella lacteola TaxID=2984193 RepID=A0ABU9BQS1_9BURK
MATGPADPADLSLLSGLAPELAKAFVSVASDIALVIDPNGVIRNVAVADAGPNPPARQWVGRQWEETVTGDTRQKIKQLLLEASSTGVTRRREVNHPSGSGPDIPISYAALRLGEQGPLIAVGRDLRAVGAIQQRFIEAQQELERDYWKLRQAQTRDRLLAQVASDAVMVLDGESLAVIDANPTADELFGGLQQPLPAPIAELLAMARRTARAAEVRTRLGDGGTQIELSATPFRAPGEGQGALRLLVRARPASFDAEGPAGEGVVVTDSSGRVLMANDAFVALCRCGVEAQVRSQLLTDALGDPDRRLAALMVDVRRDGLAQASGVSIGHAPGQVFGVEVCAALLADGDQECIGLTLRRVALTSGDEAPSDKLAAALRGLIERVGELPLPELMQQAAELAERHAIESAMHRAASELRAAARLLGLNDHDLALRLQRLGIAVRR